MNKYFQFTGLLIISMFLYISTGVAQDETPTTTVPSETDVEETAPESEEIRAGQEVEVNEDNYRQFMELKDARQQRNMLPETSYQSQAGLEKLDKLPEESQKHLRNQLREIIVQGDQWQPGDKGTEYPYVPSEAASTDQSLQKQEADAWGELVDNYHKREAEIYANSSRSQAAAASANATGGGDGGKEGSASGNTGQGREGQQANQQSGAEQGGAADSYSPNASDEANAKSTAGVSQNAMEFLQQSGSQGAQAGESSTGSPASNNGQGEAQEQALAQDQAQGQAQGQTQVQAQVSQQNSNEQNRTTSESSTQSPSDEPDAESTTGTSQNALEYLTGDSTPTTQPGDQEGTLTIEDLMNAQGVGNAAGAGVPSGRPADEPKPDENDPDKDGGS